MGPKSLANWKRKQGRSAISEGFVSRKCFNEASLPAELRRRPDIENQVNATFVSENEKLKVPLIIKKNHLFFFSLLFQ